MGVDDFVDVGWSYMPVPDGFWINDHRGAELALVEAAGFVGANLSPGMPRSASFHFEDPFAIHLRQLDRNSRVVAFFPFVVANENVFFKFGH